MGRIGLILSVLGFVYFVKPFIFRKLVWKKDGSQPVNPAVEKYRYYMQVSGAVLLIAGIVVMAIAGFKI